MHASLKILSLLLSYPEPALVAAVPEFESALRADELTGPAERDALLALANDIAALDLYDAQERYVWLFDRTRALSLHLFEHVHGESRDRGQAMVSLLELYAEHDLEIDARELPDYLPLFLEFVSTRPAEHARRLLGQASPVLAAVARRLHDRDSVYAQAFDALVRIADGEADAARVAEILAVPVDDPSDLEALDRVWQDEVVAFGGTDRQSVGLDELKASLGARGRGASGRDAVDRGALGDLPDPRPGTQPGEHPR